MFDQKEQELHQKVMEREEKIQDLKTSLNNLTNKVSSLEKQVAMLNEQLEKSGEADQKRQKSLTELTEAKKDINKKLNTAKETQSRLTKEVGYTKGIFTKIYWLDRIDKFKFEVIFSIITVNISCFKTDTYTEIQPNVYQGT